MLWTGAKPHESRAIKLALEGTLLRFFTLSDENTFVLKRLLDGPGPFT